MALHNNFKVAHPNFSKERTTVEISLERSDKKNQSTTGPRDTFYRASPGINYPTPSFLHSGASMRMTNADSANDNNRERQRGRKVLCTYRPDAVSSESPELQYITGYGVNCLQPGSDLQELHRNAQTTATKSGSFPLQSARPLT